MANIDSIFLVFQVEGLAWWFVVDGALQASVVCWRTERSCGVDWWSGAFDGVGEGS